MTSCVTMLTSSFRTKTEGRELTAGLLLHELPLAVDDTQDEQG